MCDTVTLLGTIGFFLSLVFLLMSFLLMSWLVFKAIRRDIKAIRRARRMGDDSVPGSDDDQEEGDDEK